MPVRAWGCRWTEVPAGWPASTKSAYADWDGCKPGRLRITLHDTMSRSPPSGTGMVARGEVIGGTGVVRVWGTGTLGCGAGGGGVWRGGRGSGVEIPMKGILSPLGTGAPRRIGQLQTSVTALPPLLGWAGTPWAAGCCGAPGEGPASTRPPHNGDGPAPRMGRGVARERRGEGGCGATACVVGFRGFEVPRRVATAPEGSLYHGG